MESESKQTPIELANARGAYAEIQHPNRFGPTLSVTVFNRAQDGPQYVNFKVSYGVQTTTAKDLQEPTQEGAKQWEKKLQLFEIRAGVPEAGKSSLDSTPIVYRLEKKNTYDGNNLVPILQSPNPSQYEISERIPTKLPSKHELITIARILEDQKHEIAQIVNEATPPDPQQYLLGQTVHNMAQKLQNKGLHATKPVIERIFNAPSMDDIVEFIYQEASHLPN